MGRRFLFAAMLFLSSLAMAEPIHFIYTGTGSGSLGGVPFNDLAFTITGVGDTDNVVFEGAGIHTLIHSSTTVTLVGIGTYSVTTPVRTFVNTSAAAGGLGRTCTMCGDLYTVPDPAFASWDLTTAIGPVVGSEFRLLNWSSLPVITTDGGELFFQLDAAVDGTFEAVLGRPPAVPSNAPTPVPVIPPWGLAILAALLGLIGLARVGRHLN